MNQYDADMEAEAADNERDLRGKAEQEEAAWLALTPEERARINRDRPEPPLSEELPF